MIDPTALSQFIDSQGWSFYGVVDFESAQSKLNAHRPVFNEWIKRGFHATMDYLPRMAEDRYQPKRKLPDTRSALVLAAWYGFEQNNCSIGHGTVSRYAGGRDYHKVLMKKLVELSDWLKSQNMSPENHASASPTCENQTRASASPTCENYISVDSGPMADRVLAEAAGLGFFGKNTCLIHPSRGSFFFIASLLTTLRLEPTPKKPMPNCGNCPKCKAACPTGALKSEGVIDSNRCIAYLTIENKGAIPVDLRPLVGNRLFGCDACQEACPFNVGRAKIQKVRIGDLGHDHGVGESLDLAEILSIRSDDEYLRRFAGTPLMRSMRSGLLRNACVVAGNSSDKAIIPHLDELLVRETDPMVREHAEWALLQLKKID